MLMLERRVVSELTTTDDPALRARIAQWVNGSLRDMSDVLRLGVVLETLLLTVWVTVRRPAELHGLLGWLDRCPIALLRSYTRLFRSLVLFGELELSSLGDR